MRLTVALGFAVAALVALALWASGALAWLGWQALGWRRAVQDLLAHDLAAIRSGDAAAFWTLTALCGVYGVLHAVGPGHGKALVAGAAVASRATARRMAAIAVLGSLAQAGVAIALVYGGFALVGATARGLTEDGAAWLTGIGDLLIAGLGAYLVARGVAAWPRSPRDVVGAGAPGHAHASRHAHASEHAHGHDRPAHAHGHVHRRDDGRGHLLEPQATHAHGPTCGCGHAHGPTARQVQAATTPAATLALVAGMAARPCTGALFVLVIAWRLGLPWAGVAAVLAMGLGTALVTGLVGWFAATGRDIALAGAGGGAFARRMAPALQIAAGGAILTAGTLLLLARAA